jgi:hypothetical protein
LAETLDRYGIQLSDAVSPTVTSSLSFLVWNLQSQLPKLSSPESLSNCSIQSPLPLLPAQPALTKQEQQNLPPEQAPVPNGRPQTLPPPQQ